MFVNSTNVPFLTNKVYHFKFTIDPRNRVWEGAVTNITDNPSLGFNTTAATGKKFNWLQPFISGSDLANSTNLLIISRNNTATETNVHSLDNVMIYQIPQDTWQVVVQQTAPAPTATFYEAAVFYPASAGFTFTATTFGLTNMLPATNFALVLNGTTYSTTNGLVVGGSDSDTNRTASFFGLQTNKDYNGFIIVADQAGRATTNTLAFDTFVTQYRINTDNLTYTNVDINPAVGNAVTVIEGENYNFDPTQTACNLNQTDVQSDRYIQNWVYPRYAANASTNATADTTNSYFARVGMNGIDFFCPTPTTSATYWRNCELASGTPAWRMRNGGRPSRQFLDFLGVQDMTFEGEMVSNSWWNYTHDWGTTTNYIAYLRGGVQRTNFTFTLCRVVEDATSSYTNSTQTSNRLAQFQMPVLDRKNSYRNYPLLDNSGYATILPLGGLQTLKLAITAGQPPGSFADAEINYMVFIPVPDIKISNSAVSGTDFSFSFNSELNVHYTPQYKDDLLAANWQNLPAVIGTGGQVTVHDNTGGGSRVYRVVTP
jgi:hypothetical protein